MKKRKDNKGRVLKDGESQRKDGRYVYRYTDKLGRRPCIYAKTLDELRKKEQDIIVADCKGVMYADGSITVIKLIDKYIDRKNNVKDNTKERYIQFRNRIAKSGISNKMIRDVNVSMAKDYCIELSKSFGFKSVQAYRSLLKCAFQMAYEEDAIVKNPFDFRLDFIKNDTKKRHPISDEVAKKYLDYLWENGWYRNIYNDVVILLYTGLRVSELYGLTTKDVDMDNRIIYVNKQLHANRTIGSLKTDSGERQLAMNEEVYQAFKREFEKKKKVKVEKFVDGYTGFIFYNKSGKNLKTRRNLGCSMRLSLESYERDKGEKLPEITPHILRHTFCSKMVRKKIPLKVLQSIMGHADIQTTLDVYAELENEFAVEEMRKYC